MFRLGFACASFVLTAEARGHGGRHFGWRARLRLRRVLGLRLTDTDVAQEKTPAHRGPVFGESEDERQESARLRLTQEVTLDQRLPPKMRMSSHSFTIAAPAL